METITDKDAALAAFVLGTTWVRLPDDVRERALPCLMDACRARLHGTRSLLALDKYHEWVRDLGEDFILRLIATHDVEADRVRRMVVVTYPDALRLHAVHPATTEAAQSSIAWPVAALLVDREVATEQVANARTGDTRLHELAVKVGFVASEELQALLRRVGGRAAGRHGRSSSDRRADGLSHAGILSGRASRL